MFLTTQAGVPPRELPAATFTAAQPIVIPVLVTRPADNALHFIPSRPDPVTSFITYYSIHYLPPDNATQETKPRQSSSAQSISRAFSSFSSGSSSSAAAGTSHRSAHALPELVRTPVEYQTVKEPDKQSVRQQNDRGEPSKAEEDAPDAPIGPVAQKISKVFGNGKYQDIAAAILDAKAQGLRVYDKELGRQHQVDRRLIGRMRRELTGEKPRVQKHLHPTEQERLKEVFEQCRTGRCTKTTAEIARDFDLSEQAVVIRRSKQKLLKRPHTGRVGRLTNAERINLKHAIACKINGNETFSDQQIAEQYCVSEGTFQIYKAEVERELKNAEQKE